MSKLVFDLVVTRHSGTLEFLQELGLCDNNSAVKTHVSADDVRGKNVVGVLPHHLSCLCNSFTELNLNVPEEWRGKDLTCEQVRSIYRGYVTYKVVVLEKEVSA